MLTAEQARKRYRRLWLLGVVLCAGCGPGSFMAAHPPRFIPVSINYLPHLVKSGDFHFPPARVLVFRPTDKRAPYPVKKGKTLPADQDNTAILGIWGINSEEGTVIVNSYNLGAQRRMEAGVNKNPDTPHGIFIATNLPRIVQDALVSHFHEAGFTTQTVSFVSPNEAGVIITSDPASYAVGCAIEKFSLVSLERHHEMRVDLPTGSHVNYIPIRGPTRAEVSLTVTFYRWPSGTVLWEGNVAGSVDDPPLGENEFLYSTVGEVSSMALSRAVGSILGTQGLQDALLSQ